MRWSARCLGAVLVILCVGGEARAVQVIGTLSGFIPGFSGALGMFLTPPLTDSTCCRAVGGALPAFNLPAVEVTGQFTYDTNAPVATRPNPFQGIYVFTHDASLSYSFPLFDGTTNTYSTHASPEGPITIRVQGGGGVIPGDGVVDNAFFIGGTLADPTNPTPHVLPQLRDFQGASGPVTSGDLPTSSFASGFIDAIGVLTFEQGHEPPLSELGFIITPTSITTVPEPAGIGLLGLALVALAVVRAWNPASR